MNKFLVLTAAALIATPALAARPIVEDAPAQTETATSSRNAISADVRTETFIDNSVASTTESVTVDEKTGARTKTTTIVKPATITTNTFPTVEKLLLLK